MRYDVVLSFAGEDRDRASELAFALKRRGLKVFYDNDEVAILWGENLYERLGDIFQTQSRFCIPILSRHYVQKPWTLHELKFAQARNMEESNAYLLTRNSSWSG